MLEDDAAIRARSGNGFAIDGEAAARGGDMAGKSAEQRGLAATGGS